jgi:hypothetical protein
MKRPTIPAWRLCLCVTLAIVFVLIESGAVARAQTSHNQTSIKQNSKQKNRRSFAIRPTHNSQASANSPGPSSPTETGRPPRVGPNTRDNAAQQAFPDGLLGRSETSIVTSGDGSDILVGFNDAQGFCGPPFGALCTPETPPGLSGYAYSTNGGLTFTDGGAPDPAIFDNVFTRGDPWMDRGGFDDLTFYYSNLAVDFTTGAPLGVSIHRGHFSGSSFSFSDVHTVNSSNPNDSYDKDAFAAAHDKTGAAYVTVTNFIELCGQPAFGFGQIEVWRTHDGGNSWQGPSIAAPDLTFITDPTNPNCGLTGTIQQGSAPAIGPHGELYVTWLQGPTFTGSGGSVESTDANIEVATSLDGGVTFGPAVTVASTNVSFLRTSPAGYNRFNRLDSPRIAVATSGNNAGRVYVTFTSETSPAPIPGVVICPSGLPAGSICVGQDPLSEEGFISFSDDKGLTWTTPTPFAPAVPADGVKRMWPVPTVEPGGNVDVIYYESQEAPTAANPECVMDVSFTIEFRVGARNSLVDTFWVQSTNGGSTFAAPVKVTTATSNWCTVASDVVPNFGDYISSFATGNHVYPSWADGRNGIPDTFDAVILGGGHSQ